MIVGGGGAWWECGDGGVRQLHRVSLRPFKQSSVERRNRVCALRMQEEQIVREHEKHRPQHCSYDDPQDTDHGSKANQKA